jgi:hypothetical protein
MSLTFRRDEHDDGNVNDPRPATAATGAVAVPGYVNSSVAGDGCGRADPSGWDPPPRSTTNERRKIGLSYFLNRTVLFFGIAAEAAPTPQHRRMAAQAVCPEGMSTVSGRPREVTGGASAQTNLYHLLLTRVALGHPDRAL